MFVLVSDVTKGSEKAAPGGETIINGRKLREEGETLEDTCRKLATAKIPESIQVGNVTVETPLGGDARANLLAAFKVKYGHQLSLENQPNDTTLALVVKMHARKAIDFITLSKIGPASDTHTIGAEPVRLKDTPFLIDSKFLNMGNDTRRKKNDYLSSADSFVHSVRVLMYAYVLASSRDAQGWNGVI